VTHTIVFDFDGTLALGRGPLLAYARCVSELVADGASIDIGAALTEAIEQFECGEGDYRDAYDAVRQASLLLDVDEATLSRGYMASRELLAGPQAPVIAPRGIREFLEGLPSDVMLTLVTNAPNIRITEALQALDVDDLFSERVYSARKPAGLEEVIGKALKRGPVLSVGDIFEYDLAPAIELGAQTALVGDASGKYTDRVTMHGATLADLYSAITSWAANPAVSPTVPTGTRTNNERHN
jgi:FMN phosphatase YigB (HAD superfamily)